MPPLAPPASPSSPPVFTCTFCHHISTERPHLLGHSLRLTCSACYSALLDLSICWACGEVVFRGDECVSFGWCFWHRGCYGCLLYGSRAVCQGWTVEDLYANERDEDDAGTAGTGREIEVPPLCAYCVVEAEVDEIDEEGIVEKGMERVARYDGGVSRCRQKEKDSIATGPLRAGLDGMADESDGQGLSWPESPPLMDSTIWVDIFDPINNPSFIPSRLKPIPWFMARPLTPGTEALRRPSALDRYLHSPSPLNLSSPSAASTVCPSRSSTPMAQLQVKAATPPETDGGCSLEARRQRTFSVVREEPLMRPSSRLAVRAKARSGSDSDGYLTAVEWPQSSLDAVLCAGGLPPGSSSSSSSLAAHVHRRWREQQGVGHASPEQSTEYLQRYQRATKRRGEDGDGGKGKRKRGVGAELRRLFMGR